MNIIEIPVKDPKNPPNIEFPKRCVSCGLAKETTLGLSLDMGVQKRDTAVVMKMTVPMCNSCAEKERRVAMVTLVPFLIAGFLVGIVVFVPVTLIAPEGTTPQTLSFPYVLGGFVGLIAGIIGGTVVEFIVKILAAPFFGKLMIYRPLTILGFLSNTDELVGVSAKYIKGEKIARFVIENDAVAREFVKLNVYERV